MESVKSRDDDMSSVVIVTPAEPETEIQEEKKEEVKTETAKGKLITHPIFAIQDLPISHNDGPIS